MKILVNSRWMPVNLIGVQMNADDSSIINIEMDVTFMDEVDAETASKEVGAGAWDVLFDQVAMNDGEKMIREAMGRGRPVTREEMVAQKLMGGLDQGCIAIRSMSVEKPPKTGWMQHVPRARECRARVCGWFQGRPNEVDEILKGIAG